MENKCNSCGEEFDEPNNNQAMNDSDSEEYVCPFCGSEDWDTNYDLTTPPPTGDRGWKEKIDI